MATFGAVFPAIGSTRVALVVTGRSFLAVDTHNKSLPHRAPEAHAAAAPRGAIVHSSCTGTRKGLADTTANPLHSLGLFGGLDGN